MDRKEPVDILHPLTSLEWRECRSPPADVSTTHMVCLGDKVYIGGWSYSARALSIYCPATDTWDKMDTPVYNFALTVYRSQLVLVGGREIGDGSPSNKVWTLGEDGQWQTTLPPMETTCIGASAVSHGDHLFVFDRGVYICNGRNWARAQHPIFSSISVPHISSTVIDGCWYVMRGTEVHYTSLDSLLASCQPSDTPQSSSVWERLPDAPIGSSCLADFGSRLVAVGGSAILAFSPTTQSWVEVGGAPHVPFSPCAIALPSNELFVFIGSVAYSFTILAECVESCLKAKTVDKFKERMAKEGSEKKSGFQDQHLKQRIVTLEKERDTAVDQVEQLRFENVKLRHSLQEVVKKELQVEEKSFALVPVKTELKEEATTVTKAETTSDIAAATPTWVLPGVEVCGEMTVVVHSSRSQQITWEGFGLQLHIDEDSLPAGMEQCTLKIMASLAGQYELPEKSCLVSAVFWLRCEPMCKFTKPVTVEIQHCAKSENVGYLTFVRAVCSQKQLPYTFKELGGGEFNRCRSYGVIKVLDGFSGLAVTQEGSEDREYCSQLFYLGQPNSCQIHFVVTWNTEAHLTVVKEKYNQKGAVHDFEKEIEFESDSISLDIPNDGIPIKDWTIEPKFPPVVTKKQVDNYDVGKATPYCQLLAQVSGRPEKIPSVTHRIAVKGSKQHDDFFLISLPYEGSFALWREQTFEDSASVAVDLNPPPNKRSRLEDDRSAIGASLTLAGTSQNPPSRERLKSDHHASLLRQLEKHAAHWRDIGTELGFKQGELDNTEANTALTECSPKSYLSELLSKWLEWAPGDRRNSEGFATLEGLKDALRQVNLGATAHDLHL